MTDEWIGAEQWQNNADTKTDVLKRKTYSCAILYITNPTRTDLGLSWESYSAIYEIPSILWNPRFSAVFTRTCHWFLPSAMPIWSMPSQPATPRTILIYPPLYNQVFQVVSFLQVSTPNSCINLSPPIYDICPVWNPYFCMGVKLGLSQRTFSINCKPLWTMS